MYYMSKTRKYDTKSLLLYIFVNVNRLFMLFYHIGCGFPPHPCLTPPTHGNPLEVLDETYPAKLEERGHSTAKLHYLYLQPF